jgi:uncharacterized phage protein (TIGR01671 family)
MREIKFRAWDIEIRQIVYPHKIDFNLGYAYYFDSNEEIQRCETSTLMQDTGFKDKNGTKIYERDIVKILDYYNNVGIVEYSAPHFHIFDGDDGATDFDHNDWAYFEVIGNIYETPELLDKD